MTGSRVEGRWTIPVSASGQVVLWPYRPDLVQSVPVPVVPCDDAAVKRAMQAVSDTYEYEPNEGYARRVAEAVLEAAARPSSPRSLATTNRECPSIESGPCPDPKAASHE